ncbi:hypothetical protein [Glycomyces tenuis]|uniref:hypothetical protein n=1 Tax=Glycomyces tenuis TaxID=58116 RepID=UPI000408C1D7|nr:hypothetical protein [Glycomyces tenuis]
MTEHVEQARLVWETALAFRDDLIAREAKKDNDRFWAMYHCFQQECVDALERIGLSGACVDDVQGEPYDGLAGTGQGWADTWLVALVAASRLGPIVRDEVMLPIFKHSTDPDERAWLRSIAMRIRVNR